MGVGECKTAKRQQCEWGDRYKRREPERTSLVVSVQQDSSVALFTFRWLLCNIKRKPKWAATFWRQFSLITLNTLQVLMKRDLLQKICIKVFFRSFMFLSTIILWSESYKWQLWRQIAMSVCRYVLIKKNWREITFGDA